VKERALSHQLPQAVGTLLRDDIPEVRAAALYSLGTYMRVEKDGNAAAAAGDFNGSNGRAGVPSGAGGGGSDAAGPPSDGPTADGDRKAGGGARAALGLGGPDEEGKAR